MKRKEEPIPLTLETRYKIFKEFLKPYYWKPVFWKRGYCAVSSGGASLDVLKRYIEQQGYND